MTQIKANQQQKTYSPEKLLTIEESETIVHESSARETPSTAISTKQAFSTIKNRHVHHHTKTSESWNPIYNILAKRLKTGNLQHELY